ncbi:ATP-binding protein [Streptomyces sp. NPDC026672]|uniref:ATP-binding protein n=1 Tax=unclassified Streptomyces TaxID=2593676 RepID=UPI0033C99EC4
MAPRFLPQPLDRLPEDRWPAQPLRAARFTAATDYIPYQRGGDVPRRTPEASASTTRPPGGEQAGRLPGPLGPDPLASGAEPPPRSRTFDLPATPASVGTARRGVHDLLIAWDTDEETRDNAVIVTSELVTNAVTHSDSERIVCRLLALADRIRVEVEDQDRCGTLPTLTRPEPDVQNGRGLLLVEALSTDWGVTDTPQRPGRVVWAELATAVAPPPARHPRPTPHSAEGIPTHGPFPPP